MTSSSPKPPSVDSAEIHPVRAPYIRPQLQVYGDLRQITGSIAAGSNGDGMSGSGMTKTAP